jgi:hypothetical protein
MGLHGLLQGYLYLFYLMIHTLGCSYSLLWLSNPELNKDFMQLPFVLNSTEEKKYKSCILFEDLLLILNFRALH